MLLTLKTTLVLVTVLFSTYSEARQRKVIYGDDDRKDVFEIDMMQTIELSRSTAAMVSHKSLKFNEANQTYSVPTPKTLEKRLNVCPSVKFSDQPSVSICSGFLVAEDILVTAGHCVHQMMVPGACENYSWVFDYKMETEQSINLDEMPKDNVYTCSKVIKSAYDSKTGEDFAIIQLDRKVVDRTPLKLNREKDVEVGTDLFIVGNPWGLPTKVAAGASVKGYHDKRKFNFEANLDSFQANSGSAVFNAKTGAIEGILVAGKKDAIPSIEGDPNSCLVLNHCSDKGGKTCEGKDGLNFELVTKISTILKYLP